MANFIDKLIGYIAPGLALKREQARMALTLARDYDAAARGRRTANVRARSTSANTETSGHILATLRDRSRDLVRNNNYAGSAIEAYTTNIVGTGIRPSFSGPRVGAVKLRRIKEMWKRWAESTDCDFDGVTNFYGLQELAIRSAIESGESLIVFRIWPEAKPNQVPLQLQVIEADHIDTAKDGYPTSDGGRIQQGVEYNKAGKRVAYWLFQDHPGEWTIHRRLESVRVPASEVLRIYKPKRAGQIRGVPVGVSTHNDLRDLSDYRDAERVRKKIAACFSVFVTDSSDPMPGQKPGDGGYQLERVEPGIIEYLAPGQEVQFGTPPTAEGFGDYMQTELKGVASGFGVTYEDLTGDYSQVNFSSGRMGHIRFQKVVKLWQQNTVIPSLCNPVLQRFLDMLVISGAISAGVDELEVTWTLPSREMISPVEETKALKDQIRLGVKSWQDAVRESGQDPEVVLEKLAADRVSFDSKKLILDCDPTQTDGQGQTPTRLKPAPTSGATEASG